MWPSESSDSPPEAMKLSVSDGSNSLTSNLGNTKNDMHSMVSDSNMVFDVPQARQSIQISESR